MLFIMNKHIIQNIVSISQKCLK